MSGSVLWCHTPFTFIKTGADKTESVTPIYFRDESQIFFMDSEIKDLAKALGSLHPWCSNTGSGQSSSDPR